jgi:hypothetical protein
VELSEEGGDNRRGYIASGKAILRAVTDHITAAVPEKDRRLWFTDNRHPLTLDYIDGWNDALDQVEQALDGPQ